MRLQKGCMSGFCGLCYENVRGRANHPGHAQYHEPRPFRGVQMIFDSRRSGGGAVDAGDPVGVSPDSLSASYPLVFQFLTLERYGDGERRVPGSITLFFDAGALKACLNDKDAGLSAFVSGGGLAGLLESIERGLEGDRLDWRAPRQRKGRR